tara:strand:+ start:502 stop:804 length:303 start_codon:yes stop_codon:yes gene_type:complete
MKKKDRKRFDTLRQIGCIACGKNEPVIHHIRKNTGLSLRPNHEHTIPLCAFHHNMGNESVHLNKSVFEKKFGTEKELLEETNVKIEQLEKEGLFYGGRKE